MLNTRLSQRRCTTRSKPNVSYQIITIRRIENFGAERSRKAVHDWVQKADLLPASNANPDHIALNETVIQINGQQFWLYAAVDPETNRFLHIRLFTTTTTALSSSFCERSVRNTTLKMSCSSSITHSTLLLHCSELDSNFRRFATEVGMLSNVSFER